MTRDGSGERNPTGYHPPRTVLMGGSAGGSQNNRLMADVLTVAPSDGGGSHQMHPITCPRPFLTLVPTDPAQEADIQTIYESGWP